MEEKILICEDSLEGIFTAVYQAYAWRLDKEHAFLQIGEEENLRLFAEYITVAPEPEKAEKVASTVIRMMGEEGYWDLCCMLASNDREKGQAVYRTIVTALKNGQGRNVLSNVKEPYIQKAFEIARNVNYEIHHMYGFLRFAELENGILYAKIGPKNNIATLLAPHFADRFPLENFMIHDAGRQIYVLHPAKKGCFVVTGKECEELCLPEYSKEELYFQSLFVEFCHTIAIKERENLKLQRNMLPLRFQEFMVEMGKK